ncbi:MAG: hypothetical protein A2309_13750 [Bacteroidetes bacterium RIFOXYB2_FULL_35_7]|nr:MAG: hypothetical protein A2309_13750 [Bacteroidetes bacterium RIFOXYB2_FULL_35_7]
MMKTILSFILIAINFCGSAQPFINNSSKKNIYSFKSLQQQFDQWISKDSNKNKKGWKNYKRWQSDAGYHLNSFGEIPDPTDYIKILTEHASRKNSESAYKSSLWYPVGPNVIPSNQTGYMENGIGRINCIAFHPTQASTYFVGVAQGGVWKTVNDGQTWIPLTDELPITRISDIAIDPLNPDVIYISVCDFAYIGFGLHLNGRKRNTHYGLGVYKTTNGGQTWSETGLTFNLTDGEASLIKKIIIHPDQTNKLIACGVNGLDISTDAGLTWTHKLDTLFWDMVQDPANSEIIYAASGWVKAMNIGNAGIYKSTNFGQTWTQLVTNIPETGFVQRIKLAIAPSDPALIYAVAIDTLGGFYGLYKSENSGSTWQFSYPGINIMEWDEGFNEGGQGNYDLALLVHPQDKNTFYVGGINMWGSVDGGTSYQPISHWTLNYGPTIHADIHSLNYNPLSGNFFACCDGGIYKTNQIILGSWDDGYWLTEWQNIGNGLAVSSFYRLSSSKNNNGKIIAGAQDNASFLFDGASWKTVIGGDGMDNLISPFDNNVIIGSAQYGTFYNSFDGGDSFNYMYIPTNNEVTEWTTPIVPDLNIPGTLYAGFSNVYKSEDDGVNWTPVSSFPPANGQTSDFEISAFAVAESNSNCIYVAKRVKYEYNVPGRIFKTLNGGSLWADITSNLPSDLYYTSIEIDPLNENIAYVSMAGFTEENKVFKTTNGGQNWENITFNLSNIPINCIKKIPAANSVIIATDIGLYILDENTNIWLNKSLGLPNVIVSDIEFNSSLNQIYVSTFGRGIWAANLDALVDEKIIQFSGKQIVLYPNINSGTFNISIQEELSPILLNIEVFDVSGKKCFSGIMKSNTDRFQIENAKSGVYYVKITGKNLYEIKKIIVE